MIANTRVTNGTDMRPPVGHSPAATVLRPDSASPSPDARSDHRIPFAPARSGGTGGTPDSNPHPDSCMPSPPMLSSFPSSEDDSL